jgi:hypothetical protein
MISVIVASDQPRIWAVQESIKLAVGDLDVVVVSQDRVLSSISEAQHDIIHVAVDGVVFLPKFYEAMLTTMDFEQADFVACGMMSCMGPGKVVTPEKGNPDFSVSQMIFKKWAAKELGFPIFSVLCSRLMGEYRGALVPHVLCVRM